MKVIADHEDLTSEFERLIKEYPEMSCAVAWASVGFPAFDTLIASRDKIRRSTIGTHFYQTHPDILDHLCDHPHVRFVLRPDGVFHPKLYLFWNKKSDWTAIIGSPNFTRGAFELNSEIAVLITVADEGAPDALTTIQSSFLVRQHDCSP